MHSLHALFPRRPLTPVDTLPLFVPLSEALLSLLRGLTPEQWQAQTVCGDWTVKDVAAHLLGGNLGRLSVSRADCDAKSLSGDELVAFINRSNASWVTDAARIGPSLLIDFLARTDRQVAEFFETLPPDAPSHIGVSWAGDAISPNWFDIAREYTEKWVHQQHIRDAVHLPGAPEAAMMSPVLDTFMRALPYTYRSVSAPDGTALNFTLSGNAGDHWTLCRHGDEWQLFSGLSPNAACHVWLFQVAAWRLFTKGFDGPELHKVLKRIHIDGDRALGEHIATMVTIVA
jgi:uncharacterized protein (TIGR03083 family)